MNTITQHRKSLGLTQARLAKLFHVSTATVSRWESSSSQGRQAPDLVELVLKYMIQQKNGSALSLEEYLGR